MGTGWIFEEAEEFLLFILDVIMYGGFFLGFRLLEVHTEIFMGGMISCLEFCFSLPLQRERWPGRSMGGAGSRRTEGRWCAFVLFLIFSKFSGMKEQ